MAIQIPCVSCRVATSADEGVVAVACATCGVALPAPDARGWHLMRGSTTFGPYNVAELAAFIAEGRILPSDNIWHDGATVRIAVGQLPPLGAAPAQPAAPQPAAPQPAAAAPAAYAQPAPAYAPQPHAYAAPAGGGNKAGLHIKRAFNWDLRSLPVEPQEEAALLANGVDEEDARRYLVWRRSVLLVVAIPTLLSALLKTLGVILDGFQPYSGVGILIIFVGLLPLYAMPVTAWLAAKAWDQHRRSRAILVRGWLFAFLTPLLLALVPFAWRLDSSGVTTAADRANFTVGASFLGAVLVYVTLMPAVLSLIPGVLRACLRIKALIPEAILPGLFLIAATPLYVFLFLVVFTTINQAAGNFLLILGVIALVGAPLLYMFNGRTFTRPLGTPEEVAKIGSIQNVVLIIMGIGLALLVTYAFTAELFGRSLIGTDPQTSAIRPWDPQLIQFPIEYIVRSLFTTVLVADMFMLMNLQLWRHTKEFQASPEAASYDRLMIEIEEAGGAPQQQAAAERAAA